jgi:CBS domain-containing protein
MTVQEVMNTNPITASMTSNFGEAFRTLMDREVSSLPVVDADGVYRGMFDLHDIWALLLPKAALLAMDSLPDLSFMADSQKEMQQKLSQAANRPVSQFLDGVESPVVHPHTPVKEAILLLHRHGGILPVVDRKTRRLLGVVSAWDILEKLR